MSRIVLSRLALGLCVFGAALPTASGQGLDARQAGRLERRALDMAAALGLPRPPEAAVPAPARPRLVPNPGEELDAWVRFEGSAPAVRFLRQALMRMQEAPEGRGVLAELREEYARAGRKLVVCAEDFEGSRIVVKDGVESVQGMRAMAIMPQGRVVYNRLFARFRDRDLALELVGASLAHELRHLVSHAAVRRAAPEFYDVFRHLFLDEQRARLTGYLTALRLNSGQATCEMRDVQALVRDPDAFWDDLNLMSVYSADFPVAQLDDPVAAVAARHAELRGRLERVREWIDNLPKTGAMLDIMEEREGLKTRLTELRGQYESWRAGLPRHASYYSSRIVMCRMLLDGFASPQGEALRRKWASVVRQPVIQDLEQGFRRDQRTLSELAARKGLPKSRPEPGQIGWDEFYRRVEESRREHPDYWRGFFERFGR